MRTIEEIQQAQKPTIDGINITPPQEDYRAKKIQLMESIIDQLKLLNQK